MVSEARYGAEDVVLAITRIAGRALDIRALQLLAFLAQYEVRGVIRRAIVKYLYGGEPITRAEFYITDIGVVASDEITGAATRLESIGAVTIYWKGNKTYIEYRKGEPRLPPQVVERIEKVVKKHGRKDRRKLARKTMNMLRLRDKEKIEEYIGWHVDEYLHEEGTKLVVKDLLDAQKTDVNVEWKTKTEKTN